MEDKPNTTNVMEPAKQVELPEGVMDTVRNELNQLNELISSTQRICALQTTRSRYHGDLLGLEAVRDTDISVELALKIQPLLDAVAGLAADVANKAMYQKAYQDAVAALEAFCRVQAEQFPPDSHQSATWSLQVTAIMHTIMLNARGLLAQIVAKLEMESEADEQPAVQKLAGMLADALRTTWDDFTNALSKAGKLEFTEAGRKTSVREVEAYAKYLAAVKDPAHALALTAGALKHHIEAEAETVAEEKPTCAGEECCGKHK